MVRLTGMELEFGFEYYNFNKYGGGGASDRDAPPVAILTVDPRLTWSSRGDEVTYLKGAWGEPSTSNPNRLHDAKEATSNYRYGIRIRFKAAKGVIGDYDTSAMIVARLSGGRRGTHEAAVGRDYPRPPYASRRQL